MALDPPFDEENWKNKGLSIELKKKLGQSPLKDFVQFIVYVLKDSMPEISSFKSCLFEDTPIKQLDIEAVYSRADKDINEIDFVHKDYFDDPDPDVFFEIDGHLFLYDEQYLDSISVTFTDQQNELMNWVKEELRTKEHNTQGHTIHVSDSPILTVTCKEKRLKLTLDKAAYRSYY